MRVTISPVWLLAHRELRDQFRDWRILFPLGILTLFFPLLMNAVAGAAVGFVTKYGGTLVLDRLVPFSILIIGFFPITISLVVALESFVGEKERGTIEPLLTTPILDWQLYLGKLVVGLLAPLLASYIAIIIYLLILNRQMIALPDANKIAQLLTLTAVHAILMVSGAIAISVQSTSVRAANLLASFVILPVAFLIQGESALMFWGNEQILWFAVFAVAILAALLVRVGLAHFRREYLLGREIDTLNIRWMWRIFFQAIVGKANSPIDWYRIELSRSLLKLRNAIILTFILAIVGVYFGFAWTRANLPQLMIGLSPKEVTRFIEHIQESGNITGLNLNLSYTFILMNNIRAIVLMLLLGIFSFSVLGLLIFLVNMGIIGGALAAVDFLGYSPWTIFLAGLLPHGILEIPAVILSTAAIFHLGAILVTPNLSKSMGEVFLEALAEWVKIGIGLIIPLLVIAAAIETYITPVILLQVIK